MNESFEKREAVVSVEQIAANLRAWILDLRTTTESQTTERLFRAVAGDRHDEPVGYCCLGRAAVVAGLPFVREGHGVEGFEGYGFMEKLFGLTPREFSNCWGMNDTEHKTFAQIADYIEREILPRYAPDQRLLETQPVSGSSPRENGVT